MRQQIWTKKGQHHDKKIYFTIFQLSSVVKKQLLSVFSYCLTIAKRAAAINPAPAPLTS